MLVAVASKPKAELSSALDRLTTAGLLFCQGVPPQASYVFKHALVQDAAYGTLLREPRRALHGRIAEVLETEFSEIAESQPELVARHCAEAGLIEKAARLSGKAGQRSLERSALVEAVEQLTRALVQIAALPVTSPRRREQIKLQIGLANALMHTKGYASLETKASLDQARSLIERAEAAGERLEDPLLLFSVLYGVWVNNYIAFNGDMVRELAAQFLALAEKQEATVPVMVGHRLLGISLLITGNITESQSHYDHAIALYDPVAHRPLTTRFGQDFRVATLSYRSLALWLLGYPEAARTDSERAVKEAREIGQAATLMHVLCHAPLTNILRGNYAAASAQAQELAALAEEKVSSFWKAHGMMHDGCAMVLAGKASKAAGIVVSGITKYRSTGATAWTPWYLSFLARAHADLGQLADAGRFIAEALAVVEITKAEVSRVAGEIALLSPDPDAAKAEAYFERALAIARAQQAKSWELRAAMSMARLWRDQGKRQQAHDLLAPVYGWFTEGFDTLDLKEAKALLEQLTA
jgi:predicted ATPase